MLSPTFDGVTTLTQGSLTSSPSSANYHSSSSTIVQEPEDDIPLFMFPHASPCRHEPNDSTPFGRFMLAHVWVLHVFGWSEADRWLVEEMLYEKKEGGLLQHERIRVKVVGPGSISRSFILEKEAGSILSFHIILGSTRNIVRPWYQGSDSDEGFYILRRWSIDPRSGFTVTRLAEIVSFVVADIRLRHFLCTAECYAYAALIWDIATHFHKKFGTFSDNNSRSFSQSRGFLVWENGSYRICGPPADKLIFQFCKSHSYWYQSQ